MILIVFLVRREVASAFRPSPGPVPLMGIASSDPANPYRSPGR
jgi:hypothetical protein